LLDLLGDIKYSAQLDEVKPFFSRRGAAAQRIKFCFRCAVAPLREKSS
jgi:hypothetical protein